MCQAWMNKGIVPDMEEGGSVLHRIGQNSLLRFYAAQISVADFPIKQFDIVPYHLLF